MELEKERGGREWGMEGLRARFKERQPSTKDEGERGHKTERVREREGGIKNEAELTTSLRKNRHGGKLQPMIKE